jgi:hypothetical protein
MLRFQQPIDSLCHFENLVMICREEGTKARRHKQENVNRKAPAKQTETAKATEGDRGTAQAPIRQRLSCGRCSQFLVVVIIGSA